MTVDSGYTHQVYSALKTAYHGAKLSINIPEAAAAQLLIVESAIDSKLKSSELMSTIDSKLESTIQFVKGVAQKRVTYIADSTAKQVDSMTSRPVVKNLVVPATAAVVSGFLDAGDVVIEYALPESALAGESKGQDAEEIENDSTLVVPHAKKLAFKLQRRLKQRAVIGIASLEQRKADLIKRKSDLMQVDLIAYAKGFIGTKMDAKKLMDKPPADLKKMQKFAVGVLEPYRQQLKGQWNMKVQPVLLAVTNYGEYFMEHVHEYEKGSQGAGKVIPENDSQINALISHVAHQYVEPALVRTVAVFMVLGDEMHRIRVEKIVPQVSLVKEKATAAVEVIKDRVSGRYEAGLKTLDGERVKFVDFSEKVTASAKSFEFARLVGPVQSQVYEAIQAMPWGEQKVTLAEFKRRVMEQIGNGTDKVMDQVDKGKEELFKELERLHALIYSAKEWVTFGVVETEGKEDVSPDTALLDAVASNASECAGHLHLIHEKTQQLLSAATVTE